MWEGFSMREEVLRVFIAIEVEDQDVLRNLIRIRDLIASSGADVKPVEDENIHLTLRFIGEVPVSVVEEVCKVLANLKHSRFEMHVKGVGVFPTIHRPRVVWAGIAEGSSELTELHNMVERELHRLRVPADREEFTPHITLLRVKSGKGVDKLVKLIEEFKDADFGATPVERIVLKKSTLTPRGPIYTDMCYKALD
jgi:2'-5' RNA ligase